MKIDEIPPIKTLECCNSYHIANGFCDGSCYDPKSPVNTYMIDYPSSNLENGKRIDLHEKKIEELDRKVAFLMRLTRYHQDMPGYSNVLEGLEEEYESLQK